LVTAVFKIRFPEQKISGVWITGVVADKKVKLFFALKLLDETDAEIENQRCCPA
jgi:hypothetical protein